MTIMPFRKDKTDNLYRTDMDRSEIDVTLYSTFPTHLENYYVENEKAVIVWEPEFECRSYGIKDICANIQEIRLNFTLVREGADEDVTNEHEFVFNYDNAKIDYKKKESGDGFFPRYVTFEISLTPDLKLAALNDRKSNEQIVFVDF